MHAYIMHLKVKEKNHKKIESIITLIYLIRKKTIKQTKENRNREEKENENLKPNVNYFYILAQLRLGSNNKLYLPLNNVRSKMIVHQNTLNIFFKKAYQNKLIVYI